MPIDPARARDISLAALDQPETGRAAFVTDACGGDAELRARVAAMLRAHEASGELLPPPPDRDPAADATSTFGPDGGAEAGPRDGADEFAYLSPPGKPGHLGRLGHYEVLNVIGKGGFGTVFRGFDAKLHRMVAIKVLSPELAASGTARKRFVREAQAAAAVKNDHVVAIYNVEDEARPPYLVMELIDGISLDDRLQAEGPLGVREILRIGMQAAEGLAAAHRQGLIHRDIKPGNILLENGVQRVKITDFGLARAVDDARVTASGVIAGTPMYMSPEQAEGLPLDHRSDLFSLGSVLYVMCTGRAPFRGHSTLAVLKRVVEDVPTPAREVNPEIPEWLAAVVERLQAKKAADRFATAKDVADLLGQHLAELQLHGRAETDGRAGSVGDRSEPPATVSPTPTGPRRKRGRLVAVAVLAVAATLAAVYWPRTAPTPGPQAKHDPPAEQPLPAVPPAPKDEWVSLFNGKDLKGWDVPAWAPGSNWKVEDGILVASGPSFLQSAKTYQDFHCRMEAKINEAGWGQLSVRYSDARETDKTPITTHLAPGSPRKSGGLTLTIIGNQVVNPDEERARRDTWTALEVIVRGKTFTVLIDGVKTAEAMIKEAHDRGAIQLCQGHSAGVFHVRKIEIKELPPTPAAAVQPFVVLARGDRKETPHATLADAVNAAMSGDTIEIRGDGPYLCEPADAGTKALCIRASDGFRPVLLGGKQEKPTLTSGGTLVLEGLEMQREAIKAYAASNVLVYDQHIRITHCRFLAAGEQDNVQLREAPVAEIRYSHFVAGKWSGLNGRGRKEGTVWSISHSLITGNTGCLDLQLDKNNENYRSLQVIMDRNTFVTNWGRWFTVGTAAPSTLKAVKDVAGPLLGLKLHGNLVSAPSLGVFHLRYDWCFGHSANGGEPVDE